MHPQIQTYISKIYQLLEGSMEMNFIKRALGKIEEDESRYRIEELEKCISKIKAILNELSEGLTELQIAANENLSHIKRKVKILKIALDELKLMNEKNLRVATANELVTVAKRMLKLLDNKKMGNKHEIIELEAEVLAELILSHFSYVKTVDAEISNIKKGR